MRRLLFIVALFSSICLSAKTIEGPFLILSTPYYEDGSVNYENLVKEACFAAKWNSCGVIWPQSNDAIDLLSKEERFAGMEALVKEWKKHPKKTVLTLGVNGDDTQQMLMYAKEAERLADQYGVDLILAARPPYYGKNQDDVKEYYEALANVTKRPVIIQVFVNHTCPNPSVELMIELSRKYPGNYGWIKEESNTLEANERQKTEISHKPDIKTVFSAWGGWQWLYQYREIGTAGLISERIAYTPIISLIWSMMKDGDKKGCLTEAYALYRLLIDQRFIEADSLRGYQLHYFVRLGIFDNMISRVYVNPKEILSGDITPEDKRQWKLHEFSMTDSQQRELDKCYDDVMKFVKKHR